MSVQLIQQAICYMEEHILENVSYSEVAKNVHMSSYNFHRMFSFITGMTANEYIRKRRLTLAAQDLQTTNISVIDAAYKYGYESLESFSKAFSRFHNATPRQAKQKGTNLHLFNPLVIMNFHIAVPLSKIQDIVAKYLDMKCAEIDAVLEKTRASIEEYKWLKQAVITQAVTKGVHGDRPMKASGTNWLRDIPSDWEIYRGKRLFCEVNERSETGDEELLAVSHITGITPRSQKNVNMFMSESLAGYKVCHIGDIAANTMWMWQGAIGVSAYHGVISPSYNTYRQRNGDFNSQYLDYLLRIRPLVDMYNACSTGITASRFRLYPEQFLSFKFPVPPMEEQQGIVEYLGDKVGEMDTLIQKKEQFLAELETYKKSLIYEYVTGKKEVP